MSSMDATLSQFSQKIEGKFLKSAVSFLSSTNVQSAEKEKKIAFLQKKGLTQAEIDEAFKRASNTSTVLSNTASAPVSNTLLPQSLPIPIVPPRTSAPQIIYQPLPSTPSIPVEKIFALAVIFGMGTVGITSIVVGALKKFISPILNQIAEYQRNRYNQRKEMADKLVTSLSNYHKENDDLDAVIDQGEEDTLMEALTKHQADLSTKLQKLTQQVKDRLIYRKASLNPNLTEIKSILSSIETGVNSADSPISSFKSDVRTLKAILLNRRNFPQ
ncbi:unnamed protein product [Rhizopus stolonifer]